ncbi:PRC-barrel domain containing protein [Plantactinospora sp. WMMC1484]|uniref:PRC-barrel domain containing protein n=1 Tax=Plantactinospora sp. WMMC1484 TaxID=3404122 RepID=UPI003BF4CCFD
MDIRPFAPWVWRDPARFPWSDGPPDEAGTSAPEPNSALADERAATGLTGYAVEAVDGGIGSVDEASTEVGRAYLVVDTGPWIFGRKVLLPAGTVDHVDHVERKVYIDRSREQVKDSPEYDADTFGTPEYREQVAAHYTDTYQNDPPRD